MIRGAALMVLSDLITDMVIRFIVSVSLMTLVCATAIRLTTL